MRATWIVCCLLGTACSGGDGGTDDDGGDDGGGGGGGVNENNFGEKYVEKYCAEYEDCSGESDCPLTTMATPTGYTPPTPAECDFDQAAADDCIDGEWTCDSFYGFTVVIPPPACCAVCGGDPCLTTVM